MKFEKGHISWNEGKKGIHISPRTEFKKCMVPWNKGKKCPNISQAQIGHKVSDETRRKIGRANTGKHHLPLSEERKRKFSWGGRKHSEETKAKLSAIAKERFRDKKNNPMYGKHHTEETRQKISRANKGTGKHSFPGNKHPMFGKKHKQESKEKISEAIRGEKNPMYGKTHTPEICQKLSLINKGNKPSKEMRLKMSQSQRKRFAVKSNHPNWQGGTSFIPYCDKFDDYLKEEVRNRDGRTCQLCGCKENGKKLSVHHVHYDKENCYPDLVALCLKCSSKANYKREHYETLFMNNLNNRGMLFWTIRWEQERGNYIISKKEVN